MKGLPDIKAFKKILISKKLFAIEGFKINMFNYAFFRITRKGFVYFGGKNAKQSSINRNNN